MNINTLIFLLGCGLLSTFESVRAESLEQLNCIAITKQSEVEPERVPGSEKETFMRIYTRAECLRREAARAGAEWLKTEQLLKSSLDQADSEHWETAFQLVTKARFQAETALLQAEYEAMAWQHRVIRP